MSNTLEPRQTEHNAYKTWMKDGARLVWRLSSSWMIVWFIFATTVLYSNPKAAFFLIPLTPVFFDFHLAMLDRSASNKTGFTGALEELLKLIRDRKNIYIKEGLIRLFWVSLFFLSAFLFTHLLTSISDPDTITQETAKASSSLPPWVNLFGIDWGAWMFAWFIPACWQKHGMYSFRPWLVRRLGADEETSDLYHQMVRQKNWPQLFRLLLGIMAVIFLVLTFCPILLPIVEVWWVATIRCAYHDIFDGGTKIEQPAVKHTQVLVPA